MTFDNPPLNLQSIKNENDLQAFLDWAKRFSRSVGEVLSNIDEQNMTQKMIEKIEGEP